MKIDIRWVRGRRVLLDRDLAILYGVTTKAINRAVKRNIKRFPDDFMFQLTTAETGNLKSQFVISSWGGRRKLPWAFTEQGVAMLSGLLNSDRAIEANIAIMRSFVRMRTMLAGERRLAAQFRRIEAWLLAHDETLGEHTGHLKELLAILDELSVHTKKRMGFVAGEES